MNARKKTGVKIYSITYNINREKKTTTCFITCAINTCTLPMSIRGCFSGTLTKAGNKILDQDYSLFKIIGTVRCHEDDTFDEKVGKRLAESKAKKILFDTTRRYWSEVYHTLHKCAREVHSIVIANQNAENGEENHFKELTETNE